MGDHNLKTGTWKPFPLWLLLAALLAFGSEVLFWNNPTERTLLEWLLLVPGYLALSALLLDFTVRYRPRDLFGGLVLAGIYSLSAALVLNPASMLLDLPRTLITRVMGAHAFLAAEMIGLFLALTGGKIRRSLVIGCLAVGAAWGMWVRWWPADNGLPDAPVMTMLAYGVGGLLIIFGLLALAARDQSLTQEDLRLPPRQMLIVAVVLAALFALRLLQGSIDGGALIVIVLLLVLSWAILWFRGRTKGRTLLDEHIPVQIPPRLALLISAVVFLGVGVFAYNLPHVQLGEVSQLTIIALGFTGYGLAWLPTVSLVLGIQAYIRQVQSTKM